MRNLLRQTDTYQTLVKILTTDSSAWENNAPSVEGEIGEKGNGVEHPWLTGLRGASVSYLLEALATDLVDKSFLIVLPSHHEAEKVVQDLPAYGLEDALFFPEWQNSLYDGISPPKNLVADRMACFHQLFGGQRTVIVTSIKALMYKIPPESALKSVFRTLNVNDEITPEEVIELLVRSGYNRVELVEVKGEFARRGDILDVYPLISDTPFRLDFFGDEIETIRLFDPTSQRTIEQCESLTLTPLSEVILSPRSLDTWRARADALVQANPAPKYTNMIGEITQRLEDGMELEGIELLIPMLYATPSTLFDYLLRETIVVLVEPIWMARETERLLEHTRELYEKKIESDVFMVSPDELFVPFETVQNACERHSLIQTSTHSPADTDIPAADLSDEASDVREENQPYVYTSAAPIRELDFGMQSLGLYRGKYQMAIDQIKEWANKGYLTNIFCETSKQVTRMEGILMDRDVPATQTAVKVGSISEGFINESLKLIVMSEDEVFGRTHHPRRPTTFKEGAPILSLIDLKVGDYIVHVSNGIGIYEGIRRFDIDGKPQDFLVVRYASDDMLYVPTYQIDLVQKYIGGRGEDDRGPRLDRLGGTAWQRTKAKARAAIEEMAEELLQLYATRESSEGHAFSIDTLWQQEFEVTFPYEETPDQLKTIEEVKEDMERIRPMDRLVCGDVGYGKTEVALRAAFKAVMDDKQVAVLVPTTILALQHFNTFTERFAPFPVEVEMLTRFRTPAEARVVKAGLAKGTIDIVVGTHSLLSDAMKFEQLGLLVVDEEHRFGVKHKEKIKQLKQTVDVLTLTATPIPRTLHMSLIGIRDFSVINTPPENRLPIRTYVMEYNPDVVRDAILREMDRGGQVFFVHNRVQSIASIANSLQQLVPEARIAVGHGQMAERQLENVMIDFVQYKYDVLVCTMIIESGLDIPNVNTILINRADALGLAQLYQLRGRVGRAQHQAYGYLFFPHARAITEGAQKRLQVIEEFTELGSGFKIALRDLEIRGTGNILGPQQHGHIAAVGYNMYCKLLEDTVKKLKGEEIEETVETRISLPVEAYLPDEYVPDSRQKVSLYKKISALKTYGDRKELEEEIVDRYGKIPEPVEMLLEIAELKQLSQKLGADAIVAGGEQIKITFDAEKLGLDPKAADRCHPTGQTFVACSSCSPDGQYGGVSWGNVVTDTKKYSGSACGLDLSHPHVGASRRRSATMLRLN